MEFKKAPQTKEVDGPISEGLHLILHNPDEYEALFYQSDIIQWPQNDQTYTLVMRDPNTCIRVHPEEGAGFTWVPSESANAVAAKHVDTESQARPDADAIAGEEVLLGFEDLLAEHNSLRAMHGVQPLHWSDEIAKHAQLAADECQSYGMGHCHHDEYDEGQNLSQGQLRRKHGTTRYSIMTFKHMSPPMAI